MENDQAYHNVTPLLKITISSHPIRINYKTKNLQDKNEKFAVLLERLKKWSDFASKGVLRNSLIQGR